ncbi:MAG TPA: VCBS repeat-containing protein, partial [Rhizomicrobium sp.]
MLSGLVAGDVTTANSTTLVVDTSPGPIVTFTGSGVNYSSASGDPVPTSGIVTGVKIQDYPGDAVFTSWSDFSVSATALWSAIETLDVTAFDNLFFSGNDTFIAGGFGDDFEGFGGNDRFIGGAGVNFFEGDAGFDTAQITGPLANYTIVYNNAYHNIVVSDIHGDGVTLTGVESLAFTDVTISTERKTDFSADGDSDFLWQNDSGQAAVWTINGLAQTGGGTVGGNPGPSWHVIAAGDFNNDGHADILWQNDSGQAAIWLMNGVTQIGGAQVGGNPGSAWHVKGTADFNGDGYADILWQNDNGQAAIWLMNGLTQIGGGQVGGNPGPTWHVKGAGDFNGDGRADILWQSDNGQVAIWTMNGLTQTGGATVGGNPGPA